MPGRPVRGRPGILLVPVMMFPRGRLDTSMELTTDAVLGIGACVVVIIVLVLSYRARTG